MTTPHCDTSTGTIYGCEPGSFLWWHEMGHLEFNKLERFSELKIWQSYSLFFWMFSITLAIVNKYMLFLALPLVLTYLGIEIYEERWCNKFAREHYRNI